MKNLKLFALMMIFTIILVSCSSTEEKSATAQEQVSEQAIALNDNNDQTQEAVKEAMIEEESMEIEEQTQEEQEQQTEEVEIKSQASKAIPKTTDKAKAKQTAPSTKTEKAKPASKKTITKTTEKSVKEAINKKSKQPKLDKIAPTKKKAKTKKASNKPSHSAFNTLLGKYVTSSGTVNYAGFKSQKSALDSYLKDLEENPVQSSWSKNEKMAYWINLYNAATIKLIVDNYPTSSIKNINGGKPWDKRWIKSGSKTYTLNEIENSVLRPQFKDARIHFAVNCAALSCPRLMNKAFTASNLNSLLEENTRWFINNSTFNEISEKKIQISKIFDWYSSDFGNIIDYLNKYSNTEIKSNAKVSYKEYEWKLNGK
ncbi:MAG: DUF547 domain-containing protein [Saprospiraceae bacterium]